MKRDKALRKIIEQAIKFVGLSGIGWLLDFTTYLILGLFSVNLELNNIISSWVGVSFVFVFATKKIFENNSRIPLKLKYVIYLFYQCILIFFVSKLLNMINGLIVANFTIEIIVRYSALIAKILITPITMILNFIVMKTVIEKI